MQHSVAFIHTALLDQSSKLQTRSGQTRHQPGQSVSQCPCHSPWPQGHPASGRASALLVGAARPVRAGGATLVVPCVVSRCTCYASADRPWKVIDQLEGLQDTREKAQQVNGTAGFSPPIILLHG